MDPEVIITAAIGAVTTVGGVVAGRRQGRANASKVEAEALEIAARAYQSIIAAHSQLRGGLEAELRRLRRDCKRRDQANAARAAAMETRIAQLEADNSTLRVELLGRAMLTE
jgi:hypothetical protein